MGVERSTRGAPGARRRRSTRDRGQGTAELAILLPVLLLLIVGVIEVTAALNAYITVVNSSRDGARLGSKGSASNAEIQALVVKDLGRLPNTTPPSNVTVTNPTVSGLESVRVRSCYQHTTFLQVPVLLPNSFQMCAQTTMPTLN
jgi:Flp pilus assembly protein TadG